MNNPIYIAEEFAMLDVMSKGRIIAGFVRGIGSEYHSSGTNPYFSHERFHEAHDLIVRAWTEPGRSPSTATISACNMSIYGRGPIRARIRQSGFRHRGRARRSPGPRIPTADTHSL